jgi:peptidoglycan/LPS O-acetylase OafA/YrhL
VSNSRFSEYGDQHCARTGVGETGDDARVRERSSPEHLASLTPLRGVAALWVVVFHYCWHLPAIQPDRYTGAVYKGYLAVDLFFMLSGFVISHVYHGAFAHRVTGQRYRDFLKARVARIYPLHLTVLLLFVATAVGERAVAFAHGGSLGPIPLVGERSLGAFFANLLMLQGIWARELSWNDPAWVDQPGVPGLFAVSAVVSMALAGRSRGEGERRRAVPDRARVAGLQHR